MICVYLLVRAGNNNEEMNKWLKQENLKTAKRAITKKNFSNLLDIVTVAETWDHIWKAIEAWLVQIVWQPETYEVKNTIRRRSSSNLLHVDLTNSFGA